MSNLSKKVFEKFYLKAITALLEPNQPGSNLEFAIPRTNDNDFNANAIARTSITALEGGRFAVLWESNSQVTLPGNYGHILKIIIRRYC